MKRIRSLVNAEFIATDKDGKENLVQIGSGTNFEADKIEIFKDEKENELYANVYLPNGLVMEGVLWGPKFFENQGVPEVFNTVAKEITEDELEPVLPTDDSDDSVEE